MSIRFTGIFWLVEESFLDNPVCRGQTSGVSPVIGGSGHAMTDSCQTLAFNRLMLSERAKLNRWRVHSQNKTTQ